MNRGLWVLVSAGLLLLACGASLQRVRSSTRADGLARVELREIRGDILKFDVFNLSGQTLLILRDEVLLRTPSDTRRREPGGLKHLYNVPPGGAHDLNVRFNLKNIPPGSTVEVRFERALQIRGRPIPIAPIVLSAQ